MRYPRSRPHTALAAAAVFSASAPGAVDLELRLVGVPPAFGGGVGVALYAVSDGSEGVEQFSAIDMVLTWDPGVLALDGLVAAGAPMLLFSGFPVVASGGLNESDPPADGDLYYLALGQLGEGVPADTGEGTLITTFVFTAVSSDGPTTITIEPEGGAPAIETTVFGSGGPNIDITGLLLGLDLPIACSEADLAPPFGFLDFNDVIAFLTFFSMSDSAADLAPPAGVLDFNDVVSYLTLFSNGCP